MDISIVGDNEYFETDITEEFNRSIITIKPTNKLKEILDLVEKIRKPLLQIPSESLFFIEKEYS